MVLAILRVNLPFSVKPLWAHRLREMACQLEALAVLAENLVLVPRTQVVALNSCNSSFGRSDALFWPAWAPATNMVLLPTSKHSYP